MYVYIHSCDNNSQIHRVSHVCIPGVSCVLNITCSQSKQIAFIHHKEGPSHTDL